MAIYANPFPVFQPSMRIVTAITNAFPATVTTSFNHQYLTGTIVRIDIPPGFGMQQLNGMSSPIIVTGNTTFTINIDTTSLDAFSVPLAPLQQAQSVPIGELNEMLTAAVQNVLPYSAS